MRTNPSTPARPLTRRTTPDRYFATLGRYLLNWTATDHTPLSGLDAKENQRRWEARHREIGVALETMGAPEHA